MSILGINTSKNENLLRKNIWAYLLMSVVAVGVDKVYGIFSHGVESAAMTWMFLYPLLGGAMLCFIIDKISPHVSNFTGCRLFLNIHNSGIATLTFASLLKGVFEIAGTNSPHILYYYLAGWLFIAAGLIILFIMATNRGIELSNKV